MADAPIATVDPQACVDRWRDGGAATTNALLRATAARLEQLARRMLRGYPTARGVADSADVYQGAAIRLLNAFRAVRPAFTRDFYGAVRPPDPPGVTRPDPPIRREAAGRGGRRRGGGRRSGGRPR